MPLLSLFLVGHVLLPVFDTFLEPFFHETSVSLELIDLCTSYLLFVGLIHVFLILIEIIGFHLLSHGLVVKLLQVVLHVHGLLRLVEGLETSLEKTALHLVVGVLAGSDLKSRLVVTHLSSLTKNCDIGWRVDFF